MAIRTAASTFAVSGLGLGLVLLIVGGRPARGDQEAPAPSQTARDAPTSQLWRVMPIRTEAEFARGEVGGETLQHFQGMARSPSNPDVIYLSQDCAQFWRSTDAGRTWQKTLGKNCPLTAGQSIEVDPVNPRTVMAILDSTYNDKVKAYEGLYRSTDAGDSWQLVLKTESAQQRMYQHAIACDATTRAPGGARRWYAGFPANALFRSEDGGLTWDKTCSLKDHDPLYAVQAHPADGRTVYLASGRGLFATTDRGATVAPLGNLPAGEVSAVAPNPKNPKQLYAVLKGQGLYRSEDGGRTFSLLRKADALFVFLNPAHPEVVYLTGLGEATDQLVSLDGGASWQTGAVKPPQGPQSWQRRLSGTFTGIVPDPRDPAKAVAYSHARIWRTEDAGRLWVSSSTLFTGYAWGWWTGAVAFDRFNPDRIALFCYDAGEVFTDNGGRWFQRRSVPWRWYSAGRISWTGCYNGQFQPIRNSDVILCSVGYYHGAKLIRSADAGRSWQIVDDETANHLFVGFHPDDPNLAFSEDKISTDAGATWKVIAHLRQHKASIMGLAPSRPDTMYAVTRPRNTILRSDDRGVTWRLYVKVDWVFNGHDSRPTFAIDPRDPDTVYTLSREGDLARFDGRRWTTLGVLKLAGGKEFGNFVRAVAFDPRRPEIMYAETTAAGLPTIFRSLDAGASWHDITSNLPRCGGGGLVVSPHTGDLLHGSGFGTWIYPPPYDSPKALYRRKGLTVLPVADRPGAAGPRP